jgi:hypothetical protein
MKFLRLIRFADVEENEHFGKPQIQNADDLSKLLEMDNSSQKFLTAARLSTSPLKLEFYQLHEFSQF